jgi:hypothetical protein
MASNPLPFEQRGSARSLLVRLFGTKGDDLHVVLFRLNPARSISFTDIGLAARNAAGEADVYVHVGVSRRAFTGGHRPQAIEIDGLGGLWADIDIAHPVHKKPGLPPDQDAALSIISAMGLAPGLVIQSGHGLQAWWPFAEVWAFEDAAERFKARVYARAWALTLKERARALGYTVDMVSDIARVLRVPGTLNAKDAEDVRPVDVIADNGRTISLDDVDSILLDGTYEQAEREINGRGATNTAISYGDLTLDPDAEPPWHKLDLLRDLEPRADQAWRRKRTKRTETWSSSEWDQSLATYAAQAGWSRQEIANLLIASRRRHTDDLKLRQDYFRWTIDKATAGQVEAEAIREAVSVAEEIASAPQGERPEVERSDVLTAISKSLGIEISRVIRSPSEPPIFGIETPYGNGSLGTIKIIAANQAFRNRVGEITNRFPKRLKNEQWDPLAQALLQVAEVEELGVETTLAGKAETLVSLYLGNSSVQRWSEMSEKAIDVLPIRQEPFVDDQGRTSIFLSGFRSWLAEYQHEQMTRTEIGTMLRAWGATVDTMHCRVNGKRTTRSIWRLPDASSKGVDG